MTEPDPLEFDATIEAADYAAAAVSLFAAPRARRRYGGRLFIWVAIFVGVAFMVNWWPYRREMSLAEFVLDPDQLPVWGLLALCVLVVSYFMLNRGAGYAAIYQRILKSRPPARQIFRVDARGVAVAREGVRVEIGWRAFESWLERPERHLLRYGDLEVLVIPKSSLNPNQREALVEWLRNHVAAAAQGV